MQANYSTMTDRQKMRYLDRLQSCVEDCLLREDPIPAELTRRIQVIANYEKVRLTRDDESGVPRESVLVFEAQDRILKRRTPARVTEPPAERSQAGRRWFRSGLHTRQPQPTQSE